MTARSITSRGGGAGRGNGVIPAAVKRRQVTDAKVAGLLVLVSKKFESIDPEVIG